MSFRSRIASPFAAAGGWLAAHPVAYFLALVAAPLSAQVVAAALTGGDIRAAAESGAVFGVAFATVTVALKVATGDAN